ncbi:hypothetical protein [Herpetosiphon giganteus]|uniref:hypothetical protein n=1 Tax=Herpetosiphon giganteus TaxID=2029754 RepID=UPI00195620EB|nr:hypothetical protein [Herpetosiphon giganteus]MBM7846356.1 hypothetical protein [Herpetosiphon giganteus]
MGWFNRKSKANTQSVLDQLTEAAAVSLSRRSFFKKAGGGVAALGMALAVKDTSAATNATCTKTTESCGSVRTCVACSGGKVRTKDAYYYWWNCNDGSRQCLTAPGDTVYGSCVAACPQ